MLSYQWSYGMLLLCYYSYQALAILTFLPLVLYTDRQER